MRVADLATDSVPLAWKFQRSLVVVHNLAVEKPAEK
jgi:hypothetical protein